MAAVGGGGEGLGEGFEVFGGELFDSDAGFLSGVEGVADFGFEGFYELFVGLVEGEDELPLFVGAGGGEGGALPFEAGFFELGLVGIEGLGDLAVVVAETYWGVWGDGEGEAAVLFAPGDEVFEKAF